MSGLPAAMAEAAEQIARTDRRRMDAVNAAMNTLTPYERRIVREAAVMGFVRGTMAGRSPVPRDADIVFEVVDACIYMKERYPYLAAASQGRRRRVTRTRLWPGERASNDNPMDAPS